MKVNGDSFNLNWDRAERTIRFGNKGESHRAQYIYFF